MHCPDGATFLFPGKKMHNSNKIMDRSLNIGLDSFLSENLCDQQKEGYIYNTMICGLRMKKNTLSIC